MVKNKIQIKYIDVAYSARPLCVLLHEKSLSVDYKHCSIDYPGKRQAIKAERMRTKFLKAVKDRKQLSLPSFWGHNLVTHHHV